MDDRSFTLSWEQDLGGRWVKFTNRITVYPPLGLTIEILDGPLAGSTMVHVYTPHGSKTGISVFGEFTSSQIPPRELETVVRATLERAYLEDNAALRTYIPKT